MQKIAKKNIIEHHAYEPESEPIYYHNDKHTLLQNQDVYAAKQMR